MSTNCIRCVVNKRTGGDLLCDSCRKVKAIAREIAALAVEHGGKLRAKFRIGTEYRWRCPDCNQRNSDSRKSYVMCAHCGHTHDTIEPHIIPEAKLATLQQQQPWGIRCPHCEGTGEYTDGTDCGACRGTGNANAEAE